MEKIGSKTKFLLGAQHVLAMFGATVLVPFLNWFKILQLHL